MALATAGAQVVCACPAALTAHQPKPVVIKACAGEKECCRKAELSKPLTPPKQEPCDKCNLKHRSEQAMPDRHESALAAQPTLWFAATVPVSALDEISAMPSQAAQAFASPPLLDDLFHVHSLLLN
jgi:hypothetical protein